jgi:hypothetical protein
VVVIEGTRRWQLVLEGVAPPGMTVAQLQKFVADGVSFTAALSAFVRQINVVSAPDGSPVPTLVKE